MPIQIYKAFWVFLISISFFVLFSFFPSAIYAATCGGISFEITPKTSKVGYNTIYSTATLIKIGFGLIASASLDPANQGFVIVADSGGQNDYVSTPIKPPNPAKPEIYGDIDNGNSPNNFLTGSHVLSLYRVSDLGSFNLSQRPPPNVFSAATPACLHPYEVIPLPTPTLAYIPCELQIQIQDAQGNILTHPTLDSVYFLKGNVVGLPQYDPRYYGILTIGNRPPEEYTPADKKTISKYIGTFPQPGSYKITYDIKSQTFECHGAGGRGGGGSCSRTGPINNNGHCEATINVDENGGTIIIPTVPAQCKETQRLNGEPIAASCNLPNCNNDCSECPWCNGGVANGIKVPNLKPLCDQLPTSPKDYRSECNTCVNNTDKAKRGMWTAIGCVPTDMNRFLEQYIFKYGPGMAGGVAFLYFLYGAFLILTSSGDPEKVTQGKEIIVSAISGLILIIFSVFLLKIVAQDIIGIPGFGKSPSVIPPPTSTPTPRIFPGFGP